MSLRAQKRKNKKKYFQSPKKFKHSALEPGMKGFLITCNDEHRCIKEAYNLLNEFADAIYGSELNQIESEDSDIVDVSLQLAREISTLKSERRFQQVFMKVKGVVFINSSECNPVTLVDKIFENVIDSGKKRTRFILKLKPVSITCKANESDIRRVLDEILARYYLKSENKEITYKVESKVRFNDTITSSHLIWYTRDSVNKVAPKWTACIIEPQVMISYYVLRAVCCISILDKYEKYKKYNLSIAASLKNENCESQENLKETLKFKSANDNTSVPNLFIAASPKVENSKSQECFDEKLIPKSTNENTSMHNLSIAASPNVENCKSQESIKEILIPKLASGNESITEVTSEHEQPVPIE